jgi:hypothetical protein
VNNHQNLVILSDRTPGVARWKEVEGSAVAFFSFERAQLQSCCHLIDNILENQPAQRGRAQNLSTAAPCALAHDKAISQQPGMLGSVNFRVAGNTGTSNGN